MFRARYAKWVEIPQASSDDLGMQMLCYFCCYYYTATFAKLHARDDTVSLQMFKACLSLPVSDLSIRNHSCSVMTHTNVCLFVFCIHKNAKSRAYTFCDEVTFQVK